MPTHDQPKAASVRAHNHVLGYLLKHAHYALDERSNEALAPFGITSRDLGVLRVIAGGEAKSQQEVAAVLGVDRTSMVALLDALETARIVARRPSDQDRRRNVVELTESGRELFLLAETASIDAEADFTAALDPDDALSLHATLRTLLGQEDALHQQT